MPGTGVSNPGWRPFAERGLTDRGISEGFMRRHLATGAMFGLMLLPARTIGVEPAASYAVRITSISTPVARGHQARVSVHSGPEGRCSIKVVYQGGRVSLPGLVTKRASGSGNATWKWIVPGNTKPGTYPVTVTCQSGSHTARATRQMTVTR